MSDFCAGCGTEHHWLACPEVGQSVFQYDPEWDAEEPPPPMIPNVPYGTLVGPSCVRVGRDLSQDRTVTVLVTGTLAPDKYPAYREVL